MIELRATYDQLYTNSCLGNDHIYYAELSDTPSPHPCNFDLHACCQADLVEKMKGKIIPLMHLDLQDLNPDLQAKIPLFYHGMVEMDWVISKLDEAGIVTESYLLDYEGERHEFDGLDEEEEDEEEEYFEDGEEEIQDLLSSYTGQCLRIWQEKPLKEMGTLGLEDSEKYENWVHENCVAFMNRDDDSRYPNHWGPHPWKVQANFAIPIDPDTKEDLVFVGQISATLWGLAGFKYFLFYNPEKRVVAQLMQMS